MKHPNILLLFFFSVFTGVFPREVYKRIVGGQNCRQNEAPYHVSICKDHCDHIDDIVCGGTLIRPRWVLTAAHCDILNTRVMSDTHNVQNLRNRRTHAIRRRIPYQQYPGGAFYYHDIMLLQLEAPINRQTAEVPSALQCQNLVPTQPRMVNGTNLQFLIAGLGISRYISSQQAEDCTCRPMNLRCVTLQQTPCTPTWPIDPRYQNNVFCAGGQRQDTRAGDSGGGMVINNVVYGIVQRGNDRDRTGNTPGIYTNVCFHIFRDWITRTAV